MCLYRLRNNNVRSLQAARSLWFAIAAPWRLKESTVGTAAASFALAVLLAAFAASGMQIWENSQPDLVRESKQFAKVSGTLASEASAPAPDAVPLDTPARQFTALLGTNLLIFVIGIGVSAAVFMLFARFLTNEDYSFRMALLCVSAGTSIAILGTVTASAIHVATHSMRYGINLGMAVDPLSSPFLFLWLQRIDAFTLWQAVATGVGLTTWVGLDRKYGYVVGAAVWITVLLTFYGITSIVLWILAQGLKH